MRLGKLVGHMIHHADGINQAEKASRTREAALLIPKEYVKHLQNIIRVSNIAISTNPRYPVISRSLA